ncbi:MAG: DUF2911 domain-containing protein [Gemmatimonadetes bacterium]|nr:DUF2911 domain-containing protein [Gemmatimonadota bacterium]
MLLTLLTLTLTPATSLAPVPVAPPACKTMMTDRMPLDKRASPLDSVSFTVGQAEVKVCYGRPSAKGRQVFGGLIPYGQLWRTGANEPTMIHTTGPIKVAGVDLAPGSYSLYTIPGEKEWEIILNKSTSQWGHESTYTDAVRAQEVTPHGKAKSMPLTTPVEQFTITAMQMGSMAHLTLAWEKTKVELMVLPGR